jgi:hypothetical protein
MEQLNFSKIVNVLKIAYPYYFKDMNDNNSVMFNQLYYNKLKKYDYKIVSSVIDNIITKSNYMPTLAEIIGECEKKQKELYTLKLNYLYKNGYFKTDEEYGKASMWLLSDTPIIPEWFKKELDKIEDTKLLN